MGSPTMSIACKSLAKKLLGGITAAAIAGLPWPALAQVLERPEPGVAYAMIGKSTQPQHVDSFEILLQPLEPARTAPVISALAASESGRFLAAAGDDHAIRIVDTQSGKTLRTIGGHSDWIQALEFSRDGQRLYSAGNDGRVLVWQHDYPVQPTELVDLPFAVRSLSLSSEKELLAIGGFSDEIILWDLAKNEIRFRLQCDCGDQRCVRFSPDGKQLLCGGRDGELRVWDTSTGVELADFHAHRGRVYVAAFSADGRTVTSVAEDRRLVQYDLATKTVKLERELAQAKLMSMCLVNDHLVAVAGADNSIHLYDAIADEVVAHLQGHFGTVGVMTPCGDYLASGSFDTTIRIWDLNSIQRDNLDYSKPVQTPMTMDPKLRIR